MSEDFVKHVKALIASGRGDVLRLREILDSMKQNNPVYMSDYKYVENLISERPAEEQPGITAVPSDAILEDPIGLLRIRLAEGRITVGEFRELKKTLSEY